MKKHLLALGVVSALAALPSVSNIAILDGRAPYRSGRGRPRRSLLSPAERVQEAARRKRVAR